MDIQHLLSQLCGEAVVREARDLSADPGFQPRDSVLLPDGRFLLRARVHDSFNFVDHPQVELDVAREEVTGFRCDCPDYRTNRSFCTHCAALLLTQVQSIPTVQSAAGDWQTPVGNDEPLPAAPAENTELPCLTDFSYRFCNSRWDLYPREKNPRIPLQSYIQVFGNNARARAIYNAAGGWGGSCFGMSATASMFHQAPEDIRISDFNEAASIPSELKLQDRSQLLDLTLHQLIEVVHILQMTRPCQLWTNLYLQDANLIEKLAKRVEAFQLGQGEPVLMGIWASPRFDGGHCIMPYRLEHVSPTEDVLHIYDPNWPMVARYAYLEKDEDGNYLHWRFPMNDYETYNGAEGAQLSMSPYEIFKQAWDHRGSPAVDNLLHLSEGTAVMDETGALVARVTDAGVETFREDVYQIRTLGGAEEGGVSLSLPVGIYTVCLEDSRQDTLSVRLTGVDLSVAVDTPAREVTVRAEDHQMLCAVRISQTNTPYSIEITNTAGETLEEVSLNGMTGQEHLVLAQKEGRLYASGLTDSASLYINDEQQFLDRIGTLIEDQEQDPELVVNTKPQEKPDDDQD